MAKGICSTLYIQGVDEPTVENAQSQQHASAYSSAGAKSIAKQVDNGEKFADGLIKFLQSRAEIEAAYAKRLKDWEATWNNNLTRQVGTNPQMIEAFKGIEFLFTSFCIV